MPSKRLKRQIIVCHEDDWEGPRPPSLRQLGIERIVGRTILEWRPYLGTYGMGGPGFAGFLLEETATFPQEWLVLILWGADEWLLLDGRWVTCHPNQTHLQQPWFDWSKTPPVDEFSGVVIGTQIVAAQIEADFSLISLEKDGQPHLLEIPQDTTRLPRYGGSLEPHLWNPRENQLDAWIISRQGNLFM